MSDPMSKRRRILVEYGIAVTVAAAAIYIRWLLNPLLDHRLPLATMFGAVAIVVTFAGWRPALVAMVLGYLAVDFLIISTEPDNPASLLSPGGLAGLVMYTSSCLFIIALGHGMRQAQRRAEGSAREAHAKQEQIEAALANHRRTNQALRDKQAREAAVLEAALDAIVTIDHTGRIVEYNPAAERMFGYPRTEALGLEMAGLLIPPDQRDAHREGLARYRATGRGPLLDRQLEMVAQRADGTQFPIELAITRLAKDGNPEFTAYVRDITERKVAEARLRVKESELRLITGATPLLLTRCSKDGRFMFVNRACAEFLGRPPEEIVGRTLVEVMGEEAVAAVASEIARVLEGEEVEFESEIPYANAGSRFMRVNYTPDRDAEGRVIGWLGTLSDITERRRMEETLRASERRFRLMADAAPVMIWIANTDKKVTWLNQGWLSFVGRTLEQERGDRWVTHVHPDDVQRCVRIYSAAFQARRAFSMVYRLRHHSGEYGWVLDNGIPLYGAGGEFTGYIGSCMDITGRKRTEEALRENQARLTGEAGALAKLNEVSSRLWRMRRLGDGLEEMLTATIGLLGAEMGNIQLLDEESGLLRLAAHRGLPRGFIEFYREVGPGQDSACGRAWRSGERVVIEDVDTDARYAPFRELAGAAGYRAVQATPLLGRNGRVLGVLSTHWRQVHQPGEQALRRLDLYIRQAADFIERCRADEALEEADRRKDEFLATLAHELRNPLAPIRNAVHILQLRGPASTELVWASDVIDRQVQHMARMIDDLMDVSRITRSELKLRRERVELAAVLHDAVETTRSMLEDAHHKLTVSIPPETLYLDADATRLAQVFSNLLNNAAKYSDPGSRIALIAERQESDILVSVRDEGVGIPGDMLHRIFDMFSQVESSLERTRGGLGIGLTLVKRLVELHGGRVEALSDGAGKGSQFTVRLPVEVAAPERPAPPVAVDAAGPPSRRRILIVDDNGDAAESLGMMLDVLGYETRTAGDGVEGLRAAADFRPDVTLLDIGMPGLNGYEVARRIRLQQWGQDMALIALTGWSQPEDKRRTLEAGFDLHLVKPVDPGELGRLIAELTTAGRAG